MLYSIGKFLAFVFPKVFFRLQVKGLKNIPAYGAVIVASNHVSNLDPAVIGATFSRRLCFMAMEELFRNKFFGGLIKRLGAFPLRRGKADISAMRKAVSVLKGSGALLIFPQGRRSENIVPENILPGIGFLAKKTNAVIVPARIFGTDKALPKGKAFFKFFTPIKIKYAKPIAVKSENNEEIARKVLDALAKIKWQNN